MYAGTVLLENEKQVNRLELKRRGRGWVRGKKKIFRRKKSLLNQLIRPWEMLPAASFLANLSKVSKRQQSNYKQTGP